MTQARLADGRVLNFPDGTPVEVIQTTVKRMLGVSPELQPEKIEPIRLDVPTEEIPSITDGISQLPLDPTIAERGVLLPIGRTIEGEITPALPEVLIDVLKAIMLPGQVLKGKDPTLDEIINFAASFSPAALRGGRVGLRKAIDEIPSVKVAEDELTTAIKSVEAGEVRKAGESSITELDQIARAARFKEQNIPATKGDISQQFAQQTEEQRLLSMASGEKGEPLRQLKLEQSEAFIGKVNELVDSLGVPSRTGDSIKDALTGRKTLLRAEKNKLYKEVADTAPEIANTPLFVDDIANALPSKDTLEDIAIVGANVEGIEKAFVRFGIDDDPATVEKFIKGGGTITPLTLGNFDRFRKVLGGLERADQTGSAGVAIGPIRKALDEEAAFIDDAIKESGITDEGVISTLKEARSRVRTLKTEFSPQSITGRLIGVKRDGVTPITEASKVTQELLRPNAPIENLERTLRSLRGAGSKGAKAIQDLRASVIMDALEAALKAPSRKTGGIETIGGNQFAKALSKFGDDKLDLLFKGNEKALNALLNLKQTALDITPTAGAVPRGSAPVILDLMKRAGRLPGLAAAVDAVTFVVKAGADDRAVAQALKSKPKIKQTLIGIRRDFPTIAERLGIITILEMIEIEEEGFI